MHIHTTITLPAIQTRHLSPTTFRGARIVAETPDMVMISNGKRIRITVDWDHNISGYDNHRNAAMTLAKKMGWHGQWYGGGIDKGYIFVRNCNGDGFDFEVEKRHCLSS